MTDAEYDHLQAKIQALIAKWHKLLGLDQWYVVYTYCRDGIGADDRSGPGPDSKMATVALATVAWQYLDAEIKFDMPLIAKLAPDRLEWVLVHECMHVLLHEMRWQDHTDADNLDHEERVATVLALAFIATYDRGARDGKRDAAIAC